MSRPHLPRLRVDPATLPPPLLTSEPGSFAHNTLKVRLPLILEELTGRPEFSPDIRRGLKQLHAELRGGAIQPLRQDAPDTEFWNTVSKSYFGRAWLDVPWYWAETFFYRRLLELTGYFRWGAWQEVDPFGYKKAAELAPGAAPAQLAELLNELPDDPAERFETLLHASLWGNRVDLSYNVAEQVGRARRMEEERENLLVDQTAQVWQFLNEAPRRPGATGKQIVIVGDNAGAELLMDLALVDFLLNEPTRPARQTAPRDGPYAERIVMHLKPQPFFVSDTMPQDVQAALAALARADEMTRALAERLRGYLHGGRLVLRTHWFYPTCLFYYQMPDDLYELLRAADLVILKGDVNYRRTVGDLHWKPTMAYEQVTGYFPAPLVNLRTMKAELVVGLSAAQVEELERIDPAWRVNGKRGLVQGKLRQPGAATGSAVS